MKVASLSCLRERLKQQIDKQNVKKNPKGFMKLVNFTKPVLKTAENIVREISFS